MPIVRIVICELAQFAALWHDARPDGAATIVVVGDAAAAAQVQAVIDAAANAPAAGRLRDEVKQRVASLERERIVAALARAAGNQSVAAKLLGMPRRTLVKRLRAYGIPRPRAGV